jgi:2-polyprenyl-6-methoxyphenol hydroxylase-like FAD-dependent oxidoreductase
MTAATATKTDEAQCDVAIVGYGPTGMTLAALLGGVGHQVVVLDRYQGLYNLPRAACFDDEIMRTFQKLDLVQEIIPGTVVQTDYEWVNAQGKTLLHVTYDNPARSGWAALYMMYQPHVERVLDQRCRSLDSVQVRQGHIVDGISPDEDGVTLSATDASGSRTTVRARYAVGADGGGGFVRPALGITLDDYAFAENWLVCDFHERHELDEVPTFRQVCDPAHPTSIVRIGPEHHRFSFMLDPGESPERATDPARVWQRVSPYISPDDAELIRVANYVFRSQIASRWREGRVLLAGDAAHEMPPFLAQGMCSGIRDSHNLAWKLDLILRGLADPLVLDTYQPEREPHVRFITEKAIELGRVQTLRDPEAARERDTRLLTARASQRTPDKIIYPALAQGLIAGDTPGAGELAPQGRVRDRGGDVRLLDDVTGPGPLMLARTQEVLAAVPWEALADFSSLGGHAIALEDPGVTDLDGTYAAWFAASGANAAIIRPDWYVYGTAADGRELGALALRMMRAIAPSAAEGVTTR